MTEIKWSGFRTFLGGAILTIAVAGCGAAVASPVASPTTTSVPVGTQVTSTTEATAVPTAVTLGALVADPRQTIIWGEIWNCGCHDRDGADSVAAELQFENLPSDFKTRLPIGQYDYFAISFDPKVVDQDRLEKAIKTAGGHLVKGPPAWAT